jgi:UDP-N-acetylmuramoyl-L-alanyl-D-glutamate--2,6-diaminopimelate ligase
LKNKITLKELISNLDPIRISGDSQVDIQGLTFDSRQVKKGDLFVAIRGLQKDGNIFQRQALEAGAAAIVSETFAPNSPVPFIQVRNARIALAKLAAAFYGFPDRKLHLIGITGTNGKTTTAYLIRSVLQASGRPTGLLGTVEYIVGDEKMPAKLTTPESLDLYRLLAQMCDYGQTHAVMEVSSHALVFERIHGLHFKKAVFTNLSQDHLDFHKSKEAYLAAKAQLFENLNPEDLAIINIDDPASKFIQEKTKATKFYYGLKYPFAQFTAEKLSSANSKMQICVRYLANELILSTHLRGRFNMYNILAAAAVGIACGAHLADVKEGIESVERIPGRLEPVACGQSFDVFVDYAHTPDALHNSLKACREFGTGKVIVVFGCGGNRDREKRPLMGQVAESNADLIFVTSDNPRHENPSKIIEEIDQGISNKDVRKIIPDRKEAIAEALTCAQSGDVVLIAGKGHETYQEIGGERIYFDDRVVAKEILSNLAH